MNLLSKKDVFMCSVLKGRRNTAECKLPLQVHKVNECISNSFQSRHFPKKKNTKEQKRIAIQKNVVLKKW